MYERGAQAIGEQFNKSAQWAQELIDNFYKGFPKIQQLRLKIEKMAEEYGYVTTICGRKRRLPDMQIPDKDDFKYQEAHRQSLNSVIQGSSADIMKLSMIAIYNSPKYKELDCHMLLTVHDELIMEVPEENVKAGAELLVETMKRVGQELINLPMSVDAEVNEYWYGENLADKYL
jgi:DNA polymerase I-like protein with 3'-5' exonuclease and polymerase domains